MERRILDTDQKALEINLDESIYGTFAEIGAGQEVARIFFKVGASAGTIAKTMSAYDKTYSDEIYGTEKSGRYVCESRLYKMLDHEYDLMKQRLQRTKPDTNFFVFADTISAINFQKTNHGHGWLGVRFQLSPNHPPNDLVLHARMIDRDAQQQASAIGILGVNLVYAVYKFAKDPETLVQSLIDSLQGRLVIDMIRLTGPDFRNIDNRYLSLLLVKHELSEVAMFSPDRQSIHGSEFLYKKALMVARGHYRPPTLVSLDVIRSSFRQFIAEPEVEEDNAHIMAELTLDTLQVNGEISEKDFLDRAEALCVLGQTVIISNCQNHQRLINYLSDFRIQKLGLVIGVRELLEIINEKYYANRDGNLLVAFGELFTRNIKIYAYPALVDQNSKKLMTGKNLPVPQGINFLYQYLLESQHIVEVEDYNNDLLHIFPQDVLRMIQEGRTDWERFLPEKLVQIIKEEKLFGWRGSEIGVEM